MAEDMQQNEYRRGQGRQLRNKTGGNVEIQENTNVVQANRSVAMNAASVATMGKSTGAQLLESLTLLGSVFQSAGKFATTHAQENALQGNGARSGLDDATQIQHMIDSGEFNQETESIPLPEGQAGPPEPVSMGDEVNTYIDAAVEEGEPRAVGVQRWAMNEIEQRTAGDSDEVKEAYAKEFYESTVKAVLAWDAQNQQIRRDDMGGDLAWKYATDEKYEPISRAELKNEGFTAAEINSIYMEAAEAAMQAGRFDRAREIMKREFRGKNDAAARAKLSGDIGRREREYNQEKVEEALGRAVYGQLEDTTSMDPAVLRRALGDQTNRQGLQNFNASIQGFVENGVSMGNPADEIRAPLRAMLDARDSEGFVIERGSQAHTMLLSTLNSVPDNADGLSEDLYREERHLTGRLIAEYALDGTLDGKKVDEATFLNHLESVSAIQGRRSQIAYMEMVDKLKDSEGTSRADTAARDTLAFQLRRRIDDAVDEGMLETLEDEIFEGVPVLGGAVAKELYERIRGVNSVVLTERNAPELNEIIRTMRTEFLRSTGVEVNFALASAMSQDEFLEFVTDLQLSPGTVSKFASLRTDMRRKWVNWVNSQKGQYTTDDYQTGRLDQIELMTVDFSKAAQKLGEENRPSDQLLKSQKDNEQ